MKCMQRVPAQVASAKNNWNKLEENAYKLGVKYTPPQTHFGNITKKFEIYDYW